MFIITHDEYDVELCVYVYVHVCAEVERKNERKRGMKGLQFDLTARCELLLFAMKRWGF